MGKRFNLWDAVFPCRCGICGILGDLVICSDCGALLEPANESMAVFHYSGVAGEAVRRLKYLRITSLAKPMANFVSLKYFAELEGLYDAVIPVPIHWSRRFQRGFNQAELLCEELPKGLVQPTWLKRTRATKPQVRLTPDQRLSSLIGAFRARRIVAGKSLLLVDDVVTSGGTYRACKAALLEQGAARVDLLAFAGSGRLKFD